LISIIFLIFYGNAALRKKHNLTILDIKNRKKIINCVLEGNHPKDYCLFIGPWDIYKETFSNEIKNAFTFIGIDYYFSKHRHMASKDESMSLRRMHLIWFYHQTLNALNKRYNISSVFLIAPSALGFIALEYARFFPQHLKGVILIGMPDSLQDIHKKQESFLYGNYAHSLFHHSVTPAYHHDKFKKHQLNLKKYNPIANDSARTPIDRYIAELKRDEEKYYRNMNEQGDFDNAHALAMYPPWQKVNIDFRNYFFENFMSDYDADNIQHVHVPVFASIGMYDGIAPPYLIPDRIAKGKLPKNFSYHIFEKSAHMPQYEQPDQFLEKVKEWKERIRKNDQNASIEPNVSIRAML
jgi:proline iminopeptidase